jgi:hypothetical protein
MGSHDPVHRALPQIPTFILPIDDYAHGAKGLYPHDPNRSRQISEETH